MRYLTVYKYSSRALRALHNQMSILSKQEK
jgi:hypothetical protein